MSEVLPKGWEEASIEDISTYVQRGKSPQYIGKSNLPVVNQKCVRWHKIEEEHLKYVHPEQWEKWTPERYLKIGDILWNSTGTGTIGRAAFYQGLKSSDKAVVDSHVTIIRSHDEFKSKLLHYYIMSPRVQNLIEEMQTGTTNQVELGKGQILETRLPVPPLNEQHRIVEKIDALMARSGAAKEALDAIPKLLDQYRQSVLAAAFRGDLTKDWRKKNNFSQSHADNLCSHRSERAKKKQKYSQLSDLELSKLGGLPNGWVWAKLPELGELARGKSKHRPRNDERLFGGEHPFIQTGEVSGANGYLKTYSKTYSDFGLAQSRLWPEKTVCITIAANIAETCILDIEACFPDSVVGLITLKTLTLPEYIEFFIRTAKDDLEAFAPATAQKNINLNTLYDVCVPLPPIEEQKEVVRQVKTAFEIIDTVSTQHHTSIEHLNSLNQSILTKAFRGELVPQDPTDEPASVLLERIRSEREQNAPKKRTRQKKT